MEVGGSLRRTAIENAGDAGSYSEIGLEARYASEGRWTLGLQWPFAILNLRNAIHVGMGNPAVDAEIRIPFGAARLAAGAQLGLPLGTFADGLANDHFMGTLYASLTREAGGLAWNGTLGSGMMLPWMDGHGTGMDHAAAEGGSHAEAPPSLSGQSLGNPHGNWELLYRLAAAKALGARTTLIAALDGQHVLGESMPMPMAGSGSAGEGRDFLTAELALPFTLGAGRSSPYLQMPVSPERRTGWTVGMRASLALRDQDPSR